MEEKYTRRKALMWIEHTRLLSVQSPLLYTKQLFRSENFRQKYFPE